MLGGWFARLEVCEMVFDCARVGIEAMVMARPHARHRAFHFCKSLPKPTAILPITYAHLPHHAQFQSIRHATHNSKAYATPRHTFTNLTSTRNLTHSAQVTVTVASAPTPSGVTAPNPVTTTLLPYLIPSRPLVLLVLLC